MTSFLRLLDAPDKAAALLDAVVGRASKRVFHANPQNFANVPAAPFAYWAHPKLISVFENLPPLEAEGRTARGGIMTQGDARFLRLAWEVTSTNENKWKFVGKGGAYAKYYADIHLMVNWGKTGQEMRLFYDLATQGMSFGGFGRNEAFYFRPGLTWTQRTQSGFNIRALPANCIFGHKGPTVFTFENKHYDLSRLLGMMNSQPFILLLNLQVAFGSFEVGVIQRTPVPDMDNPDGTRLGELALACVELKRNLDRTNEISHVHHLPALLQVGGDTLTARAAAWGRRIADTEAQLAAHQREIDDIAFKLYGIEGEDRRTIEEGPGGAGADAAEVVEGDDEGEGESEATGDARSLVAAVVSYLIGLPFGRWDIRYATGERPVPELPDPFAPLPVCPPGMLQNGLGLPAAPEDVPASYPLRISWPGILVDDEGHREDIEGRVREAIQVIWGERDEAIEQEACATLGAKTLREYFRKPGLFFAEHLSRYSKSRRQAPIYWPLSLGGGYTLWLYYHRLTDQTLYSCVNDFVEPKLAQVRQELAWIAQHSSGGSAEQRDVERLSDLEAELRDLHNELLRVATFWKPNFNDGVQITAAPLWRLFQHKPWQKKLKETWEKLEQGDYDWAHLAYSIWSERVREKCRADKSLAIAHGLEELYVEAPAAAKKGRGRGKKAGVEGGGMFEGEA